MPIERKSLNLFLTPEMERFTSAHVASGRYPTASEVMRAGLCLLQEAQGVKLAANVPPRAASRVSKAGA